MKILGYKSGGHDGAIAYIDDGKLVYSIEAEKNGGIRHDLIRPGVLEDTLERWNSVPAISCGDSHNFGSSDVGVYHGYSFDDIRWSKASIQGRTIDYASVPHELAHIVGSISMSELPVGQPCYVLLWEGYLGGIYYVDETMHISPLVEDSSLVMDSPGTRYLMPYHGTGRTDIFGHSAAGKIMAVAGLPIDNAQDYSNEKAIAHRIATARFDHDAGRIFLDEDCLELYTKLSYLRDVPVDDHRFIALCKALQDEIFEVFFDFAKTHIDKKLPLVISGGCGLNCEWNTQWRNSGLFSDVFVPPVTNDSGIAIGCAAAVQFLKTGKATIDWNVYAGEEFIHETDDIEKFGYEKRPLDLDYLAELIFDKGNVIAWIQGRYEIGPRALCHRSLIASPLPVENRDELNRIKMREYFRPVAPVCLEEDVGTLFEWEGASPHMLFFQKVKDDTLKAVTHFDGSARVQTMNKKQDPLFYELLQACKKNSGYGVLCNTSLNFPGRGFINRTKELLDYVDQRGISVFVIDNWIYLKI